MRTMKWAIFLTLLVSTLVAAEEKVKITTTDGKTYEGKITRVEASAITVMHTGGIARIDFARLPEEVQKKYGYDPEKAAAQRKAMANSQQARRQAILAQQQAAEKGKADAELLKSAKKQTYKVLGVVPGEGILANEYRRGGVAGSAARAISSISGGGSSFVEPSTGDLVFLYGKIGAVVDDDVLDAMIVPDGTYQYETTLGSIATVKKYRVLEARVDE